MSVALDLGSSEFRSLRQEGEQLLARRIPAHYCVLPAAPPQRRYLEQACIPYLLADQQYIVLGEHAADVSLVQNTPLVPVITHEGIPQDDPVGRQVCASLLGSLIPQRTSPYGRRLPCVTTLPADSAADSMTGAFFNRLLALMGYEMVPINSGFALVLSSLAEKGYSGLAITFGAESVSCCLAHTGVPVWEATFAGGARVAEEVMAETRKQYLYDREGTRYLDLLTIARWSRSPAVCIDNPKGPDAELFSSLYREWLGETVEQIAMAMEQASSSTCRGPLYVAIGGRPQRTGGFVPLFIETCKKHGISITRENVIVSPADSLQVARGALIFALLEEDRPVWQSAAAA
ncbi:MAG: hypothetical protein KDA90_11815 [Planctomycetaceae bacterium]|nr:hypothetical protein [Planctomycetaceae bacterium]